MMERNGGQTGGWSGRRAGAVAAGLLWMLVVGSTILSASLASAAAAWWGGGHWGRHHHGAADPEQVREHAETAAVWLLQWVEASDEQHERVRVIIGDSVDELSSLAQRHRENGEALLLELARPTIDRYAIEQIRAAELELAQLASSRLTEALADAAEVLTPEQRAELVELARRFRH